MGERQTPVILVRRRSKFISRTATIPTPWMTLQQMVRFPPIVRCGAPSIELLRISVAENKSSSPALFRTSLDYDGENETKDR